MYNYDRRGRGDSGDTKPYAVAREVEDIEALIDAAGGWAYLYGHSSGAALVLEAAIQLDQKIKKLALYEAPCILNTRRQTSSGMSNIWVTVLAVPVPRTREEAGCWSFDLPYEENSELFWVSLACTENWLPVVHQVRTQIPVSRIAEPERSLLTPL